MARIEIQSLQSETTILGIPDHPEPFLLPSGEALALDTELAGSPAQGQAATQGQAGRIVKPKIKSGKVVLLAPGEIAGQSAEDLLKRATLESNTARIALHDTDTIDMRALLPLARLVDESGRVLIVQVGQGDG